MSEMRKTILPNGLTLLSERTPGFRALSIGVWIKTGPRAEDPSQAGVSHFIEHMLFKGTRRHNARELVEVVEGVGGDFNAFTSREHTCFHVTLPTEYLKRGAGVLSDMILHSEFPPIEFKREKNVIIQEIQMYEDSPEELAFDLYFERIFGSDHGLGFPILGSRKTINRLSRRQMLDYFYQHYRPENIIVSVVGDVGHHSVRLAFKQLSAQHWPGRRAQDRTVKRRYFAKAPLMKSGLWWEKRDSQHSHLLWGVPGLSLMDGHRVEASLLNTYLGSGMGSQLNQEIREKRGLAYAVYSTHTHFTDSGVLSFYAGVEKPSLAETYQLIEKIIRRVQQKRISPKELRSVKENLKGALALTADDVESRMGAMARGEMYMHGQISVAQLCRKINAVTAGDLQSVAQHLFARKPRSVLVLGPKRPTELATFFPSA